MRKAIGIFVATALLIVGSWWWRGVPVPMPVDAVAPGEKLHCLSYAPFRGAQTPLDPTTVIPLAQIEEDLAQLSRLTGCVRIYSVDMGLDRVPEVAERHGLQVLLGIWISGETRRNQAQIAAGIALANRFPKTIRAVIVGNEVLLRGEQSAQGLKAIIETVRQQIKVPVTYADVWEFWMQNRELAPAVDFVTVHILPYWEDIPIPAADAAAHIASIRARVAAEFSGKEVLIGEAGWPSQGRMREGALPSPVAQARVLHDLLVAARTERFNVNLIEAYDQPWKRYLEGTVGGYWGLLDGRHQVKFEWGKPVSNHPQWLWQALAGVALGALVFGLGLGGGRASDSVAAARLPLSLAAIAAAAGCFAPLAVEATAIEGLGAIGWSRSLLQSGVALAVPVAVASALAHGSGIPAIEQVIGPRGKRRADSASRFLGIAVIATVVVAMEAGLGLVFNPRYLDFPFAALTSAGVPLLVLSLLSGNGPIRPPAAERVIAILLALSAIKIVWSETFANWQALWLAAMLLALSVTLARARAAQD
ncbi:MAG: beta-(1-6) glucans synthase [Hyphomicrobiales bacterium]|nr:MAG: beta-(1-6) glucans synthase [Hyphomicrobiales bacterium]